MNDSIFKDPISILITDEPISNLDSRVLQVKSVEDFQKLQALFKRKDLDIYQIEALEDYTILRIHGLDDGIFEIHCQPEDICNCINGMMKWFYCEGLYPTTDFFELFDMFGTNVKCDFHSLNTTLETFTEDMKNAPWFQETNRNVLFCTIGDSSILTVNEVADLFWEYFDDNCEIRLQGEYIPDAPNGIFQLWVWLI